MRLAVFMLGVTSHYIADINWHGLAQVPFSQGFLRNMVHRRVFTLCWLPMPALGLDQLQLQRTALRHCAQ